MLNVEELIVAGDHLVCRRHPLSTVDALVAAVKRAGRVAGKVRLLDALTSIRPGTDSPRETRTRRALVLAGLPEPTVNLRVTLTDGVVYFIDLSYPDLKIAIEYEGEHHQSDRDVYVRDIDRREALQRAGWTIILIVKEHLDDVQHVVARVRRAIADASV